MTAELHKDHRRLLALGKAAFAAENSSLWKSNLELAADRHSEAIEALHDELRRQLEFHSGAPMQIAPTPEQSAKTAAEKARKETLSHLHERLPDLIKEALEELS